MLVESRLLLHAIDIKCSCDVHHSRIPATATKIFGNSRPDMHRQAVGALNIVNWQIMAGGKGHGFPATEWKYTLKCIFVKRQFAL